MENFLLLLWLVGLHHQSQRQNGTDCIPKLVSHKGKVATVVAVVDKTTTKVVVVAMATTSTKVRVVEMVAVVVAISAVVVATVVVVAAEVRADSAVAPSNVSWCLL